MRVNEAGETPVRAVSLIRREVGHLQLLVGGEAGLCVCVM